jgi:RimJ/RimL family protein N-acetyltransferase
MGLEARTEIVELSDGDFDWMLRGGSEARNGYTLAPGGLGDAEMLRHVRTLTKAQHDAGFRGSWMMLAGREVVGLCGFHRAPVDGVVELGYGTAPERQGLGHATRAVARILATAARLGTIRVVVAETAAGNVASERVLQKNGFVRSGERVDPDDGDLIVWRYAVTLPATTG